MIFTGKGLLEMNNELRKGTFDFESLSGLAFDSTQHIFTLKKF